MEIFQPTGFVAAKQTDRHPLPHNPGKPQIRLCQSVAMVMMSLCQQSCACCRNVVFSYVFATPGSIVPFPSLSSLFFLPSFLPSFLLLSLLLLFFSLSLLSLLLFLFLFLLPSLPPLPPPPSLSSSPSFSSSSLLLSFLSSYDRDVITFSRSPQQNNPEVFMCGQQYRREIRELQHITRELNILTGRHTCSPDDEDCSVDLEAVCDYQVLNVTVDANDGSMDSFSGSGFGSGDGANVCDGGTPGTPPNTFPPSATPTTSTTAPTTATIQVIETDGIPVGTETDASTGGTITGGTSSSDLPSSPPAVVVEITQSDNPSDPSVGPPSIIVGGFTGGASTVLATLTVVAMVTMTTVLSVLL